MAEQPDLLKVSVSYSEELQADQADLLVTIKGSSLIHGAAALLKAREVRQLVEALTALGLPEQQIQLRGVCAEVSSGPLLKNSSATYQLRIQCRALDLLPDLIGAVASQKQATLESIIWRYPEGADAQDSWSERCALRANQKARRIAAALGVRLLGVYRVDESLDIPPVYVEDMDVLRKAAPQSRSRAMTSADLGLAVSHSKTVEVHMTVEYHVSRFGEDAAAASTGRSNDR
jgi:uncharacterized protein YggE